MSSITCDVMDGRIAASYKSKTKVLCVKECLVKKLGIEKKKVKIIAPDDEKMSRKLEGPSKPLGKTMLKQHFIYGTGGLLVGMIFAYVLVNHGPEFTQASPMFTYLALISPGLFVGLFVGGLMSLQPSHDPLNQDVVENIQEDKNWTLLIDTEEVSVSKQAIIQEIKNSENTAIKS